MAVTVALSEVQRAALERSATRSPRRSSATRILPASGRAAPRTCRSGDHRGTAVRGLVPEEQLDGLRQLLDALAAQGIVEAPLPAREQIVKAFMDSGPDALAGLAC